MSGAFRVSGNTILTDISGVNNINPSGLTSLQISTNPQLTVCNNKLVCSYTGTKTLLGNATGCNSVNELNIIPNFETSATIFYGATAPILASTSPNGVIGIWSPATVDNTTSGTYTFTPAVGQCATTVSFVVTVNPCNTIAPTVTNATACAGATSATLGATTTATGNAVTETIDLGSTVVGGSFNNFVDLNGTVSLPAGVTVTSAKLVFNGVTTSGGATGSYVVDFYVSVSGATTLAERVLANANNVVNGGPYNINLPNSLVNGAFTVKIRNNEGLGNLTINSVKLEYTYTMPPATINWYNVATGGTVLATGATYQVTNTTQLSTAETYTYYATANGTCESERTAVTLTVNPAITPDFATTATINSGDTAPTLASTSPNGITGTWLPETIDNTTTGTYIFTPTAGQCATTVSFVVTVNSLNSTPVLTTSVESTSFTEGTAAVIDNGIVVTDANDVTLASAIVSITSGFNSGEDILSFTNDGSTMGNISGIYNAATGILSLTSNEASASVGQWQAALRAITYDNSSITPNTTNRVISFVVNDGTDNSNVATKTVTVTAVYNAPTISVANAPISINQGESYNYTPIVTNPENNNLAFDAVNLPDWLTVDVTTGNISGTPGQNNVGTHPFPTYIRVRDVDADTAANQENWIWSASFYLTVIDQIAPTITSVLVPANGTYKAGDQLSFSLNFNELVHVNTTDDTPQVALNVGGNSRYATYETGSGSSTLTFIHTVHSGDFDADGVTIGALSLNGGTIKDASQNNAVLTLNNVGSTTNVLVDAIAPTVSSINRVTDEVTNATTLEYQVVFSKNVTGVSSDDFSLNTVGVVNGFISEVSGSENIYIVTVTDITGNGSLRLDINPTGTNIVDTPGNAIATGFTEGQKYIIDQEEPSLAISSNLYALKAGETAIITFTFSEDPGTTFSWNGTLGDVTVTGGTLSAISSTGLTRTATFTPTANINNGTVLISVSEGNYTDAVGNIGAEAVFSNIIYDTQIPTATIVVTNDVLSIGEDSLVTISFNEAVVGFDNTFLTLSNGTLSNIVSSNGGITWTGTFSPTNNIEVAINTITLDNTRLVDLAGNVGIGTTESNNYVIDTKAPVPTLISLPTISRQCTVLPSEIALPTANDFYPEVITATTTDALSYSEQGTYTITWKFVDGKENITTQQQTIVVKDTTAPVPTVVSLPTITKECRVLVTDIPVPTATDNCAGTITATTTDALSYSEQGTYAITWTYDDGNENVTTQVQTIVVKDTTAPLPTVVSLPTITKECAVLVTDIPVPTAMDNCAGTITATTTDALSYSEQGTYTITWKFVDGKENITTQQQTIVVKDTTAPVPTVVSLPTITKECRVLVTDIPVPTATDNCAGTITATTTDALSYSEQGTYAITWTYDDGNENVTTQVQTIVVKDTTAPLPTVVSLPTITKECAVLVTDIPVPTAMDNCAGTITATTTDALSYSEQGTYTIIWTYDDGNENVTTQQQTIVVKDTTAPVPTVVSLPTITKECVVLVTDIPVPTAMDNCAGTITATTTNALSYSEQGTYTIIWTYDDGNENVTTQVQTIVIKDTTAPVPTVVSLPTITKECVVLVSDIPVPTAMDNCAGTITATTTDVLAYNEQGTYTITWKFEDGNGNFTTQQQTIVVKDTTAPVPTVVSLPTITKECTVLVTDIPVPTAMDNCIGTITATTTDALSYSEQGTYTITWNFDDENGNFTTQQQTIVVKDITAPVPTVVSLPTITKECRVLVTDIPVPTAMDNCIGTITATTTDALSYSEQGTYTITWNFDDENGNFTTQQQTIVVKDITAPVPTVVSLPTITKECRVLVTDIPVPTATDNCAGTITATTTDALSYSEQGTYTITWNFDDENGNFTTQQQTIVVKDITAPVPTVVSLPTITKECRVLVTDIPVPTAMDNCIGTITATTTDALSYSEQATYTITWKFEDGNGNFTTQQQTIVVKDTTAPVPTVVSLPTITKECTVLVTDIPVPTAMDNCVGTITATTTDALSYSEQGTYTITWKFEDGNGNFTTQQQTIVVKDITAPVPTVVSLPTITKECRVLVTDIPVPTATDNCAGTITATTTDALSYSEQGTYTITWKFEDGNGNFTTQQQTIVVKDTTAPVPTVVSLPTITKECTVLVTDIPVPTATDNCAGTITATTTDALSYSEQGTYTITWKFEDGNGNFTTQQQTIVVKDTTAPVPTVVSLPTITKECTVLVTDIPVPTAMDNCAGTITATTTDVLAYNEQGTYTITWTYDDGNENVTTQQQTIVVKDTTAPVPTVVSLPTITKECRVLVTDIPVPTATDNCAGTITATTTDALSYSEQGTYTITWKFEDGNGNFTTQQQTIVVKDTTAPVPTVVSLPTITKECRVLVTDIPVPTATDNCAGTITATTTDALSYSEQGTYTITWKFEDGNENFTTQQQTIVVKDTTAPVPTVVSLPTITKECRVLVTDIPVPTATDNCAGTITATTTDALSYSEQGTYTITWKFEDGNGNFTTQQQTIVVKESPISNVSFVNQTVVYNGNAQEITVSSLPENATVTYSISPDSGLFNAAINAGEYTVTAIVTPPATAVNCESLTFVATLVIEKAPQNILFSDLEIALLEESDDYQLTAQASSGLPVNYTFTYEQVTPAAIVSTEGWVELQHSGSVFISANQEGNENYLPAMSVVKELKVESLDASLHQIFINDAVYVNPEETIYYLMDCGDSSNEVLVQLETEFGASVSPAHNFEIEMPKPGIYRETINIISENGENAKQYKIIVEKPFAFDEIVIQKFDNTLLINNNPQTNGGYKFVKFQWFRNDKLVGEEQVYSVGNSKEDLLDVNALYYVVLTTEDGDVIHTCSSFVVRKNNFKINIFPNPVKVSEKLEIVFDYPTIEFQGAKASLYSSTGMFLQSVTIHEKASSLQLPTNLSEGIYMLMIEVNGNQEFFKIVVKL